jgi:hypothetical protein
MIKKLLSKIVVICLSAVAFTACYDVEDGYRTSYSESSATFTVAATNMERGAVGDTVWYEISAQSNVNIKSIIIESSTSGSEGTGLYIENGVNDPLIDHTYGTIQKNIKEFNLGYCYIISQDTVDVSLSFSLIDEEGKKSSSFKVLTVPAITRYNSIIMYTNSNSKTDGFSTVDGMVYKKLPGYESITTDNVKVQESIDIVFIVSNNSAMFVAPYNGNFSSNFSVRNKTKLKKMVSITATDFANLTNASLSNFIDTDEVNKGATSVSDVKVGDFIGFKTDFASANSYKYGIMKINSIHPTNCDWYEGTSYVVEMEVVTQIEK